MIAAKYQTNFFLQAMAFCLAIGAWALIAHLKQIPNSVFPTPTDVLLAFGEELQSGQILADLKASLFRVSAGFLLAGLFGIPCGLVLGNFHKVQRLLLPYVNFFRSLSSFAWIPFAVLWFGIGDAPVIFLIFVATFFPLVLATVAASMSIPASYFQVASDYRIQGLEKLYRIVLPAILPQLITALRMACGIAWVTVVAAEMLAGREGLGFAIQDARNGLRTDLLVVEMIAVGCIGVVLDRLLLKLTNLSCVRWGYER